MPEHRVGLVHFFYPVADFVHWTARVTATRNVGAAARAGAAIAKHEGMDFHAASMELRG